MVPAGMEFICILIVSAAEARMGKGLKMSALKFIEFVRALVYGRTAKGKTRNAGGHARLSTGDSTEED